MDDTLKNLFLGLGAFLVIRGTFEGRARHGAERQLREAFNETGHVHVRVAERGLFGYFTNDIWSVDAYGSGMEVYRLPFEVTPRGGWKGSIRHLRLHLTDFTLNGLPVHRLEADVPFATYDLGHAFYRDRLFLRSAGVGPASVEVGAAGFQLFASRKYHATLSDVRVVFTKPKVTLTGIYTILGSRIPFTISGIPLPREGRYVDLTAPEITLNGKLQSPENAALLLRTVNPLLDIETDLGLAGFFQLDSIGVGDEFVTLRGRMTVPLATNKPPRLTPNPKSQTQN